MINDFLAGSRHFIHGAELILKPGVKRFVFIPLIINILCFIGLFVVAQHYIGVFNHWFEQYLPTWLHWLEYVIWLCVFLSFFLVMVYAFTVVANILCAPFNGSLSEAVETYLTKTTRPPQSLFKHVIDTPRILGRALSILLYYLPRALLLIILFFIPLAQFVAPIAWFLFHAWFMALTYLDYPTDNQHVTLKELKYFIQQNRAITLGFGAATLISAMIPIVNFFVIPIAVAGATDLWVSKRLTSGE